MKVYLDSSVVMRRLLRESSALKTWGDWEVAFTSVLMRIEARRTIDRLQIEGIVDDTRKVRLIEELSELCEIAVVRPLTPFVLDRAAGTFPTAIRTLDALHLATAQEIENENSDGIIFATHDARLALAARGLEFAVVGMEK